MTRAALVWLGLLVLALNIVAIRVILPALVNMHNDGAMILALSLPWAVLAADYLLWKKFAPIWASLGDDE